jgi:glutathione S-transferase
MSAAGENEGRETDVVLYRCPTRTNVLCPCGAVERRLRKLGIEHRTERVPYARKRRPEIEELTRQRRVPVLVDGDEVIHDSRRIIQYLEWKHGAFPADQDAVEDATRDAAD